MLGKNGLKFSFVNGAAKISSLIMLARNHGENTVVVNVIRQEKEKLQIWKLKSKERKRYVFHAGLHFLRLNITIHGKSIAQKFVSGGQCGKNMDCQEEPIMILLVLEDMFLKILKEYVNFAAVKIVHRYITMIMIIKTISMTILQFFVEPVIMQFTELRLLKSMTNGRFQTLYLT